MNNTQPLSHFKRPGGGNKTPRLLSHAGYPVDNTIPKITGLKDDINFRLDIRGLDFSTSPPTPISGQTPLVQFSFPVFESLRTDFPNYNAGDDVDPSYQGIGHTSYLLLDFYISNTHQNAAKIIIQGDKITTAVGSSTDASGYPYPSPYVFDFLSIKNSLFKMVQNLKPGETNTNISIVITPYDDQDFAGFPLTIMFDKYNKSFIFNQDDIDHFHTSQVDNSINITDFKLGSYVNDFFIVPDGIITNTNIDISGFCNNNDYGVNFVFKTINTDNENAESNFIFSLFPYSNVPGLNSDFPISFRDQDKKYFGTMYANDSSIRLITETSKSKTPASDSQDYFKIFNLPNTLILKENNIGIDSLMEINKRFFQNTVIVPKTNLSSSTTKFIIKANKRVKARKNNVI